MKTLAAVLSVLLFAGAAPKPSGPVGKFKAAGRLATARTGHTATLLQDGRVLVVGGRSTDGTTELNSVEIYDPAKNRWSAGAPLATGRSGHTATLLADGTVLVVGGTTHQLLEGVSRFVALASTEVFEPKSNRWSAGPPMTDARNWHTATLLADGRVLVAGGAREQRNHLSTVELFDPVARSWSPGPPLPAARCLAQATRLGTGQVMLVAGRSNQNATPAAVDAGEAQRPHGSPGASGFGIPINSSLLWSPDGGTWATLPELTDERQKHTLVALNDDRVLVIGGATAHGLSNLVEIWKAGATAWTTPEHSLSIPTGAHSATVLPSGDVLVIGGEPTNSVDTARAQLFDVKAERWCLAGELASSRKSHTSTLLPNGEVLVVGGVSAGLPEATAERWSVRAGVCEEPPGPSLEW